MQTKFGTIFEDDVVVQKGYKKELLIILETHNIDGQ